MQENAATQSMSACDFGGRQDQAGAGQEKMTNGRLHQGWTVNIHISITKKLLFTASVELGRWLFEMLAEQPTVFYKYLLNKPH